MKRPAISSDDPQMQAAWTAASAVLDPEIPVLTLEDLGVLRGIERRGGQIIVKLTPTYTGCPATHAIKRDVEAALHDAGLSDACVETVLSPPWNTDEITEEGRRKLREFGIAPPLESSGESVRCPRCASANTERISEFGSTACKALWRCADCREPFDYFKCL
ncbi:MAG: 1,2-phenylacetyl-CoA epoxidase subunit PaaD [Hyphomicrobiaceae bacterium]